MKVQILLVAVATWFLGVASTQAATITLNFDELSAGTVLDSEYSGLGVVFSNSAGSLIVQTATPGAPFTAPNAILPQNFGTVGNFNQATFSVPVSSVSVVIGDFNADSDNIFLQLFNAANVQIGGDTDFLPSTLNGGILLTASAPNIAYARFFGVGGNNNSVFFDNFTFETSQVQAPEPASLLLFASGAVGFLARRRLPAAR